MTVAELLDILSCVHKSLLVVKTGADGQHKEISAVSVEIGCGPGIDHEIVAVIE